MTVVKKITRSDVLRWNQEARRDGHTHIVHEGGSGSGKTFGILQDLITLSFHEDEKGKLYSIVRESLPSIRRSVLRDFERIISDLGLGHVFGENRSTLTFTNTLTGVKIEFVAFDVPQKARGPRRHRLYCNEANGLAEEVFRQLEMRTKESVYVDYNPSMQQHWIYNKLLTRSDVAYFRSTYKNNPFLSAEEVRAIERDVPTYEDADGQRVQDWDLTYSGDGVLVSGDPYRWAVFGLGQRGAPAEAIYPTTSTGTFPIDAPSVYGLDFGYNHPLVLLRLARLDTPGAPTLHIDEIIFASYLTTDDLIAEMDAKAVDKNTPIYADGSRPEMIEALVRAGYNCKPADKRPGSVYSGISWVKGHRLVFTPRSDRSRAQHADYRWKVHANGTVLDEPVKLNDDAPDAARYGAFTEWGKPADVGFFVYVEDEEQT